ncbi:hypothetical protein EHQ68_09330 [Leptospira congkakensis]|uniref:DUF3291 domain-containing protein n=1 Tax=Leptospira congkakensis TaxID=2484932 RepID=A0A4Z1ADH5_9LEPT|nr:hypothetical protein [Leptospira congkakensis]TGL85959.1 hypothetical protein EHQ69_17925 [Leptospira congkakensis]TGL88832.1 hypothetical protein EHQ68_09330 [Leptospira congkakensis]TGL93338.1 hypothetical protein EHQ70_17495 [Leptospira congkakensis]
MSEIQVPTQEIFSFHQFELPFYKLPYYLFFYLKQKKVKGLIHAETLIPMQLGESIISKNRYFFSRVVLVAFWKSEADLDQFLNHSPRDPIHSGWQIRLRLYRRWGTIKELDSAVLHSPNSDLEKSVVAITLARLKLSQLFRFTKWGKPVEKQVRDHPGKKLAFAAFRPLGNFLTFSIWNSEREMIEMVHGMGSKKDGLEHKAAMAERNRKDFHSEFTTLRFTIIKEMGKRIGDMS